MSDFYGLIGERLGHSISPQIHSIILKNLNSRGSYNLLEIKKERLGESIQALKTLEAKGVNVTIPYKIEVIQYLNMLSKEADNIGAVNTIAFDNDELVGYNTDYYGFGRALIKAEVEVKNKKALLLGTGGASKAISQYLIDNGINEIVYASRNPEKNSKVIKEFNVINYNEIDSVNNGDIIINCTPCGMYPNTEECPINSNILNKFSTSIDLIYNPEETIFLKEARKAGLKTVNGLYMLVAQAVAAQEIWHKIVFDEKTVEQIYNEITYLKRM